MTARAKTAVWTGRVLSTLLGLLLLFSAQAKFAGVGDQRRADLEKGMAHLGIPMSLAIPIGVIELVCVVTYLAPPTAVLGAILLTGYLGGAILAHLRVGDSVYMHVAIGVALWLAIALRDHRLWKLLPVRRRVTPPHPTAL